MKTGGLGLTESRLEDAYLSLRRASCLHIVALAIASAWPVEEIPFCSGFWMQGTKKKPSDAREQHKFQLRQREIRSVLCWWTPRLSAVVGIRLVETLWAPSSESMVTQMIWMRKWISSFWGHQYHLFWPHIKKQGPEEVLRRRHNVTPFGHTSRISSNLAADDSYGRMGFSRPCPRHGKGVLWREKENRQDKLQTKPQTQTLISREFELNVWKAHLCLDSKVRNGF